MRAIINNKIYDTEKATVVYSYFKRISEDGQRKPESKLRETTVYKTLIGNYFELVLFQDSYNYELEKIFEITEEEALNTMKEIYPDEYIEMFGTEGLEEA